MHKPRFATRAYRGSGNLRAVQTVLGHSSVATTERYTAVDDDTRGDDGRARRLALLLVLVGGPRRRRRFFEALG
jgi:integrase